MDLGLFIVLFITLLMYMESIWMSLVSFMELVICAFVSPISLTKGLLFLLVSSRDQLLSSLVFLSYLPVFNFIDFCSTFYYFFSLATLDMIYLIFQVSSDENLDN